MAVTPSNVQVPDLGSFCSLSQREAIKTSLRNSWVMGKQAGFDMELPEGMQAWIRAYNATMAPAMATTKPSTKKKSRSTPKGTTSTQRLKRKRTASQ